jgi:hypothetical protein
MPWADGLEEEELPDGMNKMLKMLPFLGRSSYKIVLQRTHLTPLQKPQSGAPGGRAGGGQAVSMPLHDFWLLGNKIKLQPTTDCNGRRKERRKEGDRRGREVAFSECALQRKDGKKAFAKAKAVS